MLYPSNEMVPLSALFFSHLSSHFGITLSMKNHIFNIVAWSRFESLGVI